MSNNERAQRNRHNREFSAKKRPFFPTQQVCSEHTLKKKIDQIPQNDTVTRLSTDAKVESE